MEKSKSVDEVWNCWDRVVAKGPWGFNRLYCVKLNPVGDDLSTTVICGHASITWNGGWGMDVLVDETVRWIFDGCGCLNLIVSGCRRECG